MLKIKSTIIILCLSSFFFGCSMIGLTVYTHADDENLHYNQNSKNFEIFENGQNLIVITNESDTIYCEFLRLSQIPYEEYSLSYNSIVKNLHPIVALPAIGDEMSCNNDIIFDIEKNKRKIVSGNKPYIFYGFEIGSILLKDSLSNSVIKIPHDNFKNCYSEIFGVENYNILDSILADGKVPFLSRIDFLVDGKVESIPSEKIKEIYIKIQNWRNNSVECFCNCRYVFSSKSWLCSSFSHFWKRFNAPNLFT